MRACSERALGSEPFKIIFLKGSLSGFYNFTKHKHIHLQMCGRQGFSSQDSDTTQEKGSRPHCKAGTLVSRGIWVGTQCFSVQRGPRLLCGSHMPACRLFQPGAFLEDSKPQSRDGEAVKGPPNIHSPFCPQKQTDLASSKPSLTAPVTT